MNGRYERWGPGRTVIKEAHPALAFYVVLDGRVEIWKLARQAMEHYTKAMETERKTFSEILEGPIDRSHKVVIAQLLGGSAFGEVSFIEGRDKNRAACVSTLDETEFLVVESRAANGVIKVSADKSLIEKTEFMERQELIKSLRIDSKTLAYYSILKSFGANLPIVTEGQKMEYMYLIRYFCCIIPKLNEAPF
jgi:hypothetical protein